MKKLVLCLFGIFVMGSMSAQGLFKIGINAGVPLSDASDVSTFMLGADVYYYFGKRSSLLKFGPSVGFRNYFGEEISQSITIDDQQFLPISLAGRVSLFGIVRGGVDVGYAVGITDGLDGGFYFRPIIAFGILKLFELNFSYENISDVGTWSNANVGLLLVF